MKYDISVIGSGPAGLIAGIYSTRKGYKTLVIGNELGGQAAISGEIENYLGYSIVSGSELAQHFREHIEKFKEIDFKEGVSVKELKKSGGDFEIIDDLGNNYLSKVVIIASGREPRWLNIPGEAEFKGRGVSACATCDGPLFRNKDVVVVGTGNSGLEAVELLIKFSNKIYLISNSDKLSGDKVLQEKVKESNKVEILYNTNIKEIKGDNFVENIIIDDDKQTEISVQGVFVEIGYVPSAHFDKLTAKDDAGAIKVNSDLETNIPGLYAAGDVNDLWGEQIIIAAGEGAKAAMRAAEFLSYKK